MVGYLCIALSACAGLAEGFFIKQYNKKHEKGGFIFTAVVSLFSMLFFLFSDIITDKTGLTFFAEMLPYSLIAGVIYCLGSAFAFFALKYGSYALTMLILSYSLVFTTAYGLIFLREQATLFTYAGFVLIALSLFFVRGQKSAEGGTEESAECGANNVGSNGKNMFLWLVFVLISLACGGFFGIIQRMQQIRFENAVTNEFMVIALSLSAVLSFCIGLYIDKKNCKQILKHGIPYAGAAGVSNGATNMLNMFVYTLMPISITAPTQAGVKIIVSFLLSLVFFKEKFLKRQILGVLLGATAIIFLNV